MARVGTSALLESAGVAASTATYRKSDTIYGQGAACTTVFYIRHGTVCLSVLSETGRGATVAVVGPGDFFGQGTLAGQTVRAESATARTRCTVLSIEASVSLDRLHAVHALSDRFIAQLLSRNLRVERDLLDHLFNGVEKRVARALLVLSHHGEQEAPRRAIPQVSQKELAAIAGITQERVNFFMDRFRERGFIAGTGRLTIHSSLLSVVLAE